MLATPILSRKKCSHIVILYSWKTNIVKSQAQSRHGNLEILCYHLFIILRVIICSFVCTPPQRLSHRNKSQNIPKSLLRPALLGKAEAGLLVINWMLNTFNIYAKNITAETTYKVRMCIALRWNTSIPRCCWKHNVTLQGGRIPPNTSHPFKFQSNPVRGCTRGLSESSLYQRPVAANWSNMASTFNIASKHQRNRHDTWMETVCATYIQMHRHVLLK
jgi:hypothetical protein